MKEIRKLYNIMAAALRKVLDRMSSRDFERLRNIDPSYENMLLHGLKERIPDLYDHKTRNVAELIERSLLIIPGFFEPLVRTLRATIPKNESHLFR